MDNVNLLEEVRFGRLNHISSSCYPSIYLQTRLNILKSTSNTSSICCILIKRGLGIHPQTPLSRGSELCSGGLPFGF